ncbi:hypothetical protein FACS1894176_08010 [Bacteroidia bacterium]|nr:hypothetical protein FACS1894176_08010 [Bacteroidia bacterium]
MPDTTKLLALPNDDELFSTFLAAAQEGAHDNIKGIVKQIGGFLDNAKGEVKRILIFDPATGLSLKFDLPTGNDVLQGFVNDQNFIVKGTLKILMATYGAQTFDSFIAKMKRTQEDIDVTRGTLTRILDTFFKKLNEKYVINETTENIATKVNALFGINDASIPEKWTKVTNPATAG